MNEQFIEFPDFFEDFSNLEVEHEIDQEFENAEEVIYQITEA